MYACFCPQCGREKLVKEKRSINATCRGCAALLAVKKRYENGNCDGRGSEKLYYHWKDMIGRTKKSPSYIRKGIKVCEEWSDYISFKKWAESNGFQIGMHLDRINPNRGYNPGNCRWISRLANTSRVNSIIIEDINLIINLSNRGYSSQDILNIMCNPQESSGETLAKGNFPRLIK